MNDRSAREDTFFQDIEHHVTEHATRAAQRAKAKLGGPLCPDNLYRFLTDPDCLRYPVEIVYDASPLEPHQFAEPVIQVENGARICRLFVHPRYRGHADALCFFVAYMAAPINYGAAATLELCESYGATLVGEDSETFYRTICAMADGSDA